MGVRRYRTQPLAQTILHLSSAFAIGLQKFSALNRSALNSEGSNSRTCINFILALKRLVLDFGLVLNFERTSS